MAAGCSSACNQSQQKASLADWRKKEQEVLRFLLLIKLKSSQALKLH